MHKGSNLGPADYESGLQRGARDGQQSCLSRSPRSTLNVSHHCARQPIGDHDLAESPAYQAVAGISLLVRRLWSSHVLDQLPGGDHRRERAGATSAPAHTSRVSLLKGSSSRAPAPASRRLPAPPDPARGRRLCRRGACVHAEASPHCSRHLASATARRQSCEPPITGSLDDGSQ